MKNYEVTYNLKDIKSEGDNQWENASPLFRINNIRNNLIFLENRFANVLILYII
ncbi:hypothetical protein [Sinanaerobacter sp. ZZT-01]|uniref:hypothetical protein n=1 Tax=Sinanaerobacter sp. ZZT-01 TaxID=3111540 RepID=UPI002D76B8DB|nr:hypothetical protein [Sinanaerobacter sp. ZZT-01]WRR94215.1 hypothetical protein U5921_03590 [Sinanaerobacter sp. ZZT-01]